MQSLKDIIKCFEENIWNKLNFYPEINNDDIKEINILDKQLKDINIAIKQLENCEAKSVLKKLNNNKNNIIKRLNNIKGEYENKIKEHSKYKSNTVDKKIYNQYLFLLENDYTCEYCDGTGDGWEGDMWQNWRVACKKCEGYGITSNKRHQNLMNYEEFCINQNKNYKIEIESKIFKKIDKIIKGENNESTNSAI